MANSLRRNLSNASSQYWCTACEYHTPSKGLYLDHVKTKEHIKKTMSQQTQNLKQTVKGTLNPTSLLPRIHRTVVNTVWSVFSGGLSTLADKTTGDNDSDCDLNQLDDEYNSDSD